MSRRLMILLSVLALAVGVLTPVAAGAADPDASDVLVRSSAVEELKASKTQTFIVQMLGDPVVAYEGDVKGYPATKPKPGKKINPNSANVEKYAGYLTAQQDAALSSVGGGKKLYNYVYSYNGFAATLSGAQASQLLLDPAVLAVSADELHTANTSTTPDFLGLTAENGAWAQGFTGEGIVIGIVDSGIWPESLSFSDRTGANKQGKDGKLDYQQIPGWHGKCTPGEEFDASMCNQKLIGAQYFNAAWGGDAGIDFYRPWEFNSPRDYNGHGTHTASTSGGNEGVAAEVNGTNLGAINGIAPRARIASYKALWSTEDGSNASGFTSDLVAAIDQAVADGVDVINYSVSGSRNIIMSPTEISFLFAADAGIFVAASAGNSGPGASTVAHIGPWLTTVAAGTHDRYYEGTVTLGNDAGDVYYGPSVDSRGAGPADLVYSANVGLPGEDGTLCHPGTLDPTLVSGKIVVCDRGAIARVDKSRAVLMADGIGMVLANVAPSSLNADLHFVPTVHVDEIDGAKIREYAKTAGATATLTGGVIPDDTEAPQVAAFSSRGPAIAGSGDLLKPDVMAPGVDILAAVAPPGNAGRDFDFYSGTSMSSPHIAGIAAVIMGAHPGWSPMMVKSAIMTTASQKTNAGNSIFGDPFGYGAGQVVPNSALEPGLVYDAGWIDWLGFLCGTGELNASYCPTIGIDPSDLNVPSIAIGALAGSQTVTRTVTNVGPAGTYDATSNAPAGVDMLVTPSSLALAQGESKSYTVTFTANDSAVLDHAAFGSLTWTHGSHSVRSPIVLTPVAIAVPNEVYGSAPDTSLSFEVQFGYTGDYTAAPHGLAEDAPATGEIGQDPDQTYPSSDDAPGPGGGVDKIDFTVADSALVRWSLVIPGDDDIDLFLEDSGGTIIAASTNGGTDELIELVLPPDDTYTLVVHGWSVPSAPLAYSISFWNVPLTPGGGSLSVDDAPASAILATKGEVDISWSGLATGETYLGAVSHSDAGEILGLTIVEIKG